MTAIDQARLDHYMGLPWTLTIKLDSDGDYVAHVKELDGCCSHGSTEGEAIVNLKAMMRLWLTDCIEVNFAITEPEADPPSGNINLKLPVQLHRRLIRAAEDDGIPVHSLIVSILAEFMKGMYTNRRA